MRLKTRIALLFLVLLQACATTAPVRGGGEDSDLRFANLQRAALYPWADDGQCAVREASNEWPVLAERCFHALEHERVRFRDVTGRCSVASTGAVFLTTGLCVFAAPELLVGAVIIAGVLVVGVAIKEGLEAYERNASREHGRPATRTLPSREREPVANGQPAPKGQGRDWFPPTSSDTAEHHPGCKPVPVPHAGEDEAHNECADRVPPNRYPGMDVLVGGKRFDALQVGARVLWEIKTHRFETYTKFLRNQVVEDQVEELRGARAIAVTCGYDFVVGVSGAAHRAALLQRIPSLKIVVTGCER